MYRNQIRRDQFESKTTGVSPRKCAMFSNKQKHRESFPYAQGKPVLEHRLYYTIHILKQFKLERSYSTLRYESAHLGSVQASRNAKALA